MCIRDRHYTKFDKVDEFGTTKLNDSTLKTNNPTVPNLPPEEMINRSFLMPPLEDGTRVRAKIIEQVNDYKDGAATNPEMIRFKCLTNDKQEEIVAYNDIVDYIKKDDGWDGVWHMREILDHHGPV